MHKTRIAFFTSVILAGLFAGLWSLRRSKSAPVRSPSAPAPAFHREADSPSRADRSPADATVSSTNSVPAAPLRTKMFSTGAILPLDQLIARLGDTGLSLKFRREAAFALAGLGTPEAFAAATNALRSSPSQIRAAITEGLGRSPHPEAPALMRTLVNDPDEMVGRAAVRGVGARGDAGSIELLGQLMDDTSRPESMRTEAVLALGGIESADARRLLVQAAQQTGNELIATHALEALGAQPFEKTREFFRDYLASTAVPTELRTAALESLGNASGDTAGMLVPFLSDPKPEVRAAAAQALSTTESRGSAAGPLVEALRVEASPEVRAGLYQALANQGGYAIDTIQSLARGETNPQAQLAAFDLLATACRTQSTPELTDFFDQTVAPALKDTALKGPNSFDRVAAVVTLRRAATPGSVAAMNEIAKTATDPRVVDAARGRALRPPR